ncbi:MAG: DNA-binding protein WhiA [Clostridia bacterium]|nr:DNA-binding protein WhiA [Clostridia bacterium]
MNFSQIIKKEIVNKHVKEEHCKKAFLAGYIRGAGVLFEQDEVIGLEIKASERVNSLIAEHLSQVYGVKEDDLILEGNLSAKKKVLTIFGDDLLNVLVDLEVFTLENGEYVLNFDLFGGKITQKECCLRAFFRGLFLACGTCTVPESDKNTNTGYHLQMAFSHSAPAGSVASKLAKFKIETKITRRKENYVVYIKSAESIKDFIAFLPAPVAVLNFTDLMINREISNKSNRQKNCDLGNLTKQVDASFKQIEAIKKLLNNNVLEQLSDDLKVTAKARVDNPEDTLNELAQKLSVSKSCLNHRLRKLVSLAGKL